MASNVDRPFVPFNNAWERIERAKAHQYALGEAWNALSDENLAEFWFHVDDDGVGRMYSTPVGGGLPTNFSLLIGECLYQLRAALDNVIYDAAILDSGQNPPPNPVNLEFPICSKAARFQELSFKLEPLSENRKAVIEAVQPFNVPNYHPSYMSTTSTELLEY